MPVSSGKRIIKACGMPAGTPVGRPARRMSRKGPAAQRTLRSLELEVAYFDR